VFKAASFKIHNPSQHKRAALRSAFKQYHSTLKTAIGAAVADTSLLTRICVADKRGKLRPNSFLLEKEIRKTIPKGLGISPLRDYIIGDATAMMMSYIAKKEKGDQFVQPPTLRALTAPTESDLQTSVKLFVDKVQHAIKQRQSEKIVDASERGETRVASRLQSIYSSWAATKAAAQMLRSTEVPPPHPLEFTHCELERGFLLAKKESRYFAFAKIFSAETRFKKSYVLEDGFIDLASGEDIGGKKYTGLIFPLEMGREHHEKEFIENGKPRSAKLLIRKNVKGEEEFFTNIVFEFTPTPIPTETVLGIDRGAAMIGAASIIDINGNLRERINLHGAAFTTEMNRHRQLVAEAQKAGRRKFNFRLRGRRSDIILAEYANRLVAKAREHKAQVVIEKLEGRAFGRFLSQSQVAKLYSMLTYKLERAGLPAPMETPAPFTSQTCANCGHQARENRPKVGKAGESLQAVFCCVRCGHDANADENASGIIALRGLHQILAAAEKGEQRPKFQKFDVFRVWLESQKGREGLAYSQPQ
jgi:transposase